MVNAKSRRYFSPSVLLIYFFSHVGLLFLWDQPFWDDWLLVDTDASQVLNTFRQTGSFFNLIGYLHVAMLSVGPWIYRVFTFILFYLTGYHFYSILRRSSIFNDTHALWAACIFLVLPFNLGKGALILFPYTLCLYLFVFAWDIMQSNRLASLLLFYLSFNIPSLLFFYCLPLAFDFVTYCGLHSVNNSSLRNLLKAIKSYILNHYFFAFLPVFFYIPKLLLFRPFGYYSGYNEAFSFSSLVNSPSVHFKYFAAAVARCNLSSLLLLLLAFSVFTIFFRSRHAFNSRFRIILISLCFLLAALFPYYIIGRVPGFYEWSTRHQLLMPFGVAIISAGALSFVRRRYIARSLFSLLIGSCLVVSVLNSSQFLLDARKQQALEQFMRRYLSRSDAGLVILDDKTPNALERVYRFYEINGMLAKAVGSQKLFGVPASSYLKYRRGAYDKFFSSQYHAAAHKRLPSMATHLILLDSSYPLKSIIPLGVRACLIKLPPPNVQFDVESFSCPGQSWITLSSISQTSNTNSGFR